MGRSVVTRLLQIWQHKVVRILLYHSCWNNVLLASYLNFPDTAKPFVKLKLNPFKFHSFSDHCRRAWQPPCYHRGWSNQDGRDNHWMCQGMGVYIVDRMCQLYSEKPAFWKTSVDILQQTCYSSFEWFATTWHEMLDSNNCFWHLDAAANFTIRRVLCSFRVKIWHFVLTQFM